MRLDLLPNQPTVESNKIESSTSNKIDLALLPNQPEENSIPELKELKVPGIPLESEGEIFTKTVDMFATNMIKGVYGETRLAEMKKKQKELDFFMSRSPRIALAFAAPLYSLAYETLDQGKNFFVSKMKGDEYDPMERRILSELLPEKTPSWIKVASSVGESLADIAIVGGLMNLAKEGLVNSALKELGAKLEKAGYGSSKVEITKEAIRDAARGTSVEKAAQSYLKAKNIDVRMATPRQITEGGSNLATTPLGKEIQIIKPIIPQKPTVVPTAETKVPVESMPKKTALEKEMGDMKARLDNVEMAESQIDEVNFIRENFKNKIKRYRDEYLKEELSGIPKYYIKSTGGISPDEAMEELRNDYGVDIKNENELSDYLKSLELRKERFEQIITENKPKFITKKETTLLNEKIKNIEKGIKEGKYKAKEEVENVQKELIGFLDEIGLSSNDKAKFIRSIKNVKTTEQLEKAMPKIAKRAKILYEEQAKKDTVREIKNIDRIKVDPDYREEIDTLLANYDLKNRTEATKKRRLSRQEFFEREVAEGNINFIPKEFFDDIGKKTLDEMSLQDVEQLRDQISVLSTVGATKRRLLSIRGEKDLQKRVNNVIESIYSSVGKVEEISSSGVPLVSKIDKSKLEKVVELARGFFAEHRKVEFISKGLGINDDIFEPIQAGINKKMVDLDIANNKLKEAFSLISNNFKSISTEQVKIEGMPVEMTREQMIGIALNSGNEGNLNRLINGNGFTQEQIDKVMENLTPIEKDFVRKIFDLIDSYFPETVDVTKKLYGLKPNKVEGDYFPIVADKDLSKIAQLREGEKDLFQDIFQTTFIERYFTKNRIGGKEPVDLNAFNVILNHINSVIHFNAMAIPVRDIQKITTNQRFKEAITKARNEQTANQFPVWLRSIANPKNLPSSKIGDVAEMFRNNATVSILGWKLSVSMLQAGSFTQTISEIGLKDAVGGAVEFFSNMDKSLEFMYANDPMMKHRALQYDREVRDWLKSKDAKKLTEGKKSYSEVLFELIRVVDLATTGSTWMGAYNKKFEETKDMEEALRYAGHIVRTTQPSASPENLAQIMKGGKLQKLFTSFMTHFSNMHNLMVNAIDEFKYSKDQPLRKSGTLLRKLLLLSLLPSILGTYVKSGGDTKNWKKYVIGAVTYPFSGLVLIRDIVNAVVGGYDFGSLPGLTGFKELGYAFSGKQAKTKIKHGLKATGMLTGKIPVQLIDTLYGTIDLLTKQTDDWRRLIWSKGALESKGDKSKKKRSTLWD